MASPPEKSFAVRLLGAIGKERQITYPLYRFRELPLVFGTVSSNPSRDNFPSFTEKLLEFINLFVVNVTNLVNTELAHLGLSSLCAL